MIGIEKPSDKIILPEGCIIREIKIGFREDSF
jgi:hypothetical protein